MIGLYFSGTGNSKHGLEVFLRTLDSEAEMAAIEEERAPELLRTHQEIAISYPVQYSAVPKILKDFIAAHAGLWKGRNVFVIATMGLFSGDGAGVLARLLRKHGAKVTGGLHLMMPDSIADEKVLKRPLEKNLRLVRRAEEKAADAARCYAKGHPPRQGLGFLSRMAGFLTQRLWFGWKTNRYSGHVCIDPARCVVCGKCARLCPTGNIRQENQTVAAGGRCTLCYRCVNRCPKQAITILGRNVVEQSVIEKYTKPL